MREPPSTFQPITAVPNPFRGSAYDGHRETGVVFFTNAPPRCQLPSSSANDSSLPLIAPVYALRAFQVHALDYVLKPVEADRLNEALAHARLRLAERRTTAAREERG